jgi:hypothetical protein
MKTGGGACAGGGAFGGLGLRAGGGRTRGTRRDTERCRGNNLRKASDQRAGLDVCCLVRSFSSSLPSSVSLRVLRLQVPGLGAAPRASGAPRRGVPGHLDFSPIGSEDAPLESGCVPDHPEHAPSDVEHPPCDSEHAPGGVERAPGESERTPVRPEGRGADHLPPMCTSPSAGAKRRTDAPRCVIRCHRTPWLRLREATGRVLPGSAEPCPTPLQGTAPQPSARSTIPDANRPLFH